MNYIFNKSGRARLLSFLFLLYCFTAFSAYGETVYWEGKNKEKGFAVDIPPDWDKDYEQGENGVVFQARNANAVMEIRSFYLNNVKSMEELVNLKAARLFSKYSYIFLLRESEEPDGKHIVMWKLKHKGVSYLEKTVILRLETHVLILSCLAPLSEYEANRYIFENAAVSLQFAENGVPLDKVQKVFKLQENSYESPAGETKPDESAKTEQKKTVETGEQKKQDKKESGKDKKTSPEREVNLERAKSTVTHGREK